MNLDSMRAALRCSRQNRKCENLLARLEEHPYWNNVPGGRSSIDDAPQLEYDEHDIDLIADRGKSLLLAPRRVRVSVIIQRADRSLISQEIDDDGLEYGKTTDLLISFLRRLCFHRDQGRNHRRSTINSNTLPFSFLLLYLLRYHFLHGSSHRRCRPTATSWF